MAQERKQIAVYKKEAIRLEALARLEAEATNGIGTDPLSMPSFFEITTKRLEHMLSPKARERYHEILKGLGVPAEHDDRN